jgi:hypothetical protein
MPNSRRNKAGEKTGFDHIPQIAYPTSGPPF